MADQNDFLIEEYKALRKEIELYIVEVRSQERYTVVAVSLIWYWLIQAKKSAWLLWLIPVFLCLASGLRLWGIDRHFKNLGPRVQEIEKQFGIEGWEQKRRIWSMERVNLILGPMLLLLTLLAFMMRRVLTR